MENKVPVLSGIEPRPYQVDAFRKALNSNLLLVLPTGLGKTLVSAMLAYSYMKEGKKVIMLSPTRPLVLQHYETMSKLFSAEKFTISALTGLIPGLGEYEYMNHSLPEPSSSSPSLYGSYL